MAEPAPGTGRLRARTEAPPPPRVKSEAPRSRTMSEAVQPRTMPESVRSRRTSEAVQRGTKSEVIHPQARSRDVQPQTKSAPPRPGESLFPAGYQSQILMYRRWRTEASEEMVLRIILTRPAIRAYCCPRVYVHCYVTWGIVSARRAGYRRHVTLSCGRGSCFSNLIIYSDARNTLTIAGYGAW